MPTPGSIPPGSICAPQISIVFPSTWRYMLCPSPGWGEVAGTHYPSLAALILSLLLIEVLERDPSLLEPSLSSNEDWELWDAESSLVSSLWVWSISSSFPFFGLLESFFLWVRSSSSSVQFFGALEAFFKMDAWCWSWIAWPMRCHPGWTAPQAEYEVELWGLSWGDQIHP